jgi:hypothetical protein
MELSVWIESNEFSTMMYDRIAVVLGFDHRPEFWILENTVFQKLDPFPSPDPISETLCFLVFEVPGDGQSPEFQ